jgi:D-sedoheptulose 7-phosphate isomerase
MDEEARDYARQHLAASREAFAHAADDAEFAALLGQIAAAITAALKSGGKILLCGNGGSAADAQHIAGELLSRYEVDRAPLAAIALTTDTSALTAISNDYGFDQAFARQLRALGRKGDVFVAISTSGRSPNMVAALKAARELGLVTVGFTKDAPTAMHPLCDLVLAVPSEETALIQQIHITAAHAICHLVEQELFGTAKWG